MQPINPPHSGPRGLSKGMITETGRLLFISGQVPMTPDGQFAGPGITEQTTQVFENIGGVLGEAGATFADVIKVTVFLCPYTTENLLAFREVRNRYINTECPPTSSLVGVSALVNPDFRIEVEAIAELRAK